MEDNTETRKKKEAEESKDIRHDKKNNSPVAPRLHATCQIYGTHSTNFNTMIVTRISAMSVASSTLLSEIKKNASMSYHGKRSRVRIAQMSQWRYRPAAEHDTPIGHESQNWMIDGANKYGDDIEFKRSPVLK